MPLGPSLTAATGDRDSGRRESRAASTWALLWDLVQALALLAAVLYVVVALDRQVRGSFVPSDFRSFYSSAVAWRHGSDPYVQPASAGPNANMNPPAFVALFSPLAVLPIWPATVAWLAFNVLAFLLSLWLVARELGRPPTRNWIIVTVAFAGSQSQISLGQVAWLCMLPATLCWRDWRRGLDARAGLWLGLLVAIKPIFLPVLGIALLRPRWRLLSSALATIGVISLFGGMACGWDAYPSWLRAGATVGWYALPLNASLRGVFARLGASPALVGAWWLSVAALLWATAKVLAPKQASVDGQLAAGFLTSLLVSPLGWVYYIPVAIGPLLGVLDLRRLSWWQWLGLAGLFWPVGLAWAPVASQLQQTPWNATVGSLYFVGLLTLWFSVRKALRRESEPGQPISHGMV